MGDAIDDDPDLLIGAARAFRLAGEAATALELLDRADQLGLGEDRARRTTARMERGWALNAVRRWPGAHEAFAAAVEADPDHVPARIWHGRALYNVSRDDEAEAELRSVLAFDRDQWLAWSFLGDLCALDGRDDEAIEAFTNVIRLDPDNGYAYFQRGLLHERGGDLEAATADWRAAGQRNFQPEDADEMDELDDNESDDGDADSG